MGAYLAEAIRKDYAAPAGFEGRAERAEAEATTREREEQERRTKALARESKARIAGYLEGLTPEERDRLDAEALAQADAVNREAYEEAATPQARRVVLIGLRNAHLRRRLDLPPTD